MEIKQGGKMALLAGVGPMGLAMINYVLHREDRRPSLFVVTDIDQARLDRAASLYTKEFAASKGIELHYINTSSGDPVAVLREISGGTGYDDVVVMAPVPAVIEQGDAILGFDGCLDFFSGPRDAGFKAPFNFYDVHYASHHIVGTSGGNVDDMKEAIDIMSKGMDPAGLITHIGGLNTVIDTTLNLPNIKGGKKMVYTQLTMPLTAIDDFAVLGQTKPVYAELDRICKAHGGLWNAEAEAYLLSHPDEL
jgi:threonine dehydrogenase-like Zn-dependent dehydrogenase